MLEEFVKNGTVGARLRASLLAPYLDSFVALVSGLGYARATIQRQVALLANVGGRLTRRGRSGGRTCTGARVASGDVGARRCGSGDHAEGC